MRSCSYLGEEYEGDWRQVGDVEADCGEGEQGVEGGGACVKSASVHVGCFCRPTAKIDEAEETADDGNECQRSDRNSVPGRDVCKELREWETVVLAECPSQASDGGTAMYSALIRS